MGNSEVLLSFRNIGKEYDSTRVLSDVSFDVHKGEIIGLVGENGAGKTTLMRILFGMTVIAETGGYEGEVVLEGQPVSFKSPFDALAAGIGMVHQEFSLIPGFTSMENILLNRESLKTTALVDFFGSRMSVLDEALMEQRAAKAVKKLGVNLDLRMVIKEMPVGHKQFTEIAREIDRENIKLLVLDEPTAVLTESEAQTLLQALKNLAAQGISIIFISHRLQEVLEIADSIVVLRDGKVVKQTPNQNITLKEIASLMVGRSLEFQTARTPRSFAGTPNILEVKHLWVDMPGETVKDVNFSVARGEILGIGGLAGQGKLGIPNGIMGLFAAGGEVLFKGERLPFMKPAEILKRGIAFVSEDRRGVGLLLDEGIDWNIGFSALQIKEKAIRPFLGGLFKWRSDRQLDEIAREYIKALDIKCQSPRQRTITLSGGNQQKVCLAKAFALDPELLFVSEPTRGIDVGAKKLVLDTLVRRNQENGTTIVMISSELNELRMICDRIAIVDEGRIAGILPADAPLEEFGLLMAGLGAADEKESA